MKEQVMIYEIKSSAAANAEGLFSNDAQYFYWNDAKFKHLTFGDYVFVVNKTNGWVLFTQLDKIDIPAILENDETYFSDLNKRFTVNRKWSKSVRLAIIIRLAIPGNWHWQGLGNSEITYLNGPRIDANKAVNRIKNIEQLKQLANDDTILQVLENCRLNFNDNEEPSAPPPSHKKAKRAMQDGMSIFTAIQTKSFILLAGISGTGKSRLARTLAYKTCHKKELQHDPKKPGNFELIPVRPNWHDSSELMGYVSRINGEKYITTAFLRFVAKAWKHTSVPFFLCLDEMNLAPVEQYFAEYLSVIETRQVQGDIIVSDYIIAKASFENPGLYTQLLTDLGLNDDAEFSEGISLPNNLVVIGTVNMDETTHSFSRKVLDRAMTFEMNHVDLKEGLDPSQNDWSYPREFVAPNEVIGTFTSGAAVVNLFADSEKVVAFLQDINNELEGTPFQVAYRVRDEFLIYCYYASLGSADTDWLRSALDEMTCMKILSRIEGDESRTGAAIDNLIRMLNSHYPKSYKKLLEMKNKLQFGYTSFWS